MKRDLRFGRSVGSSVVAICGNPNSGKTTIFNAITGLNQKVGNYPGVTVEKVTGFFEDPDRPGQRYQLVDIPGTYSLAAFSPDEYIAASALYGGIDCEDRPDVLVCVVDATNLERGLYLLLQVMQVGLPVIVALNMSDVASRRGIRIDYDKLSDELGGIPVVPVVGNRARGIDDLKRTITDVIARPVTPPPLALDADTENLVEALRELDDGHRRTRAEYLRIVFDIGGPAEKKYLRELESAAAERAKQQLGAGRERIQSASGTLAGAETMALTKRAAKIAESVTTTGGATIAGRSEKLDRFLLHPVLGPIALVVMMTLVFQSIFSWAEPFMNLIDHAFASLAETVAGVMPDGPLQSLLTDGVIGGVGSVLIFLPQIAILFIFIAFLEDTGYMARAAFLVDRMFRWCGLSGKSFIPMLSSFACAVPGIMATRTIEDRKLRFITIMVAPLMTCSARLPVYAIMIAAFVPHRTYLGVFNLQGLTLTALYVLGIVVAVAVSFVLQKTLFRTERGTFIMEMPSYKVPTLKSVMVRVFNRIRSFILRAGTVIFAITIIVWALSYYPRSASVAQQYGELRQEMTQQYQPELSALESSINRQLITLPGGLAAQVEGMKDSLTGAATLAQLEAFPAIEEEVAGLPADVTAQLEQLRQTRSDYLESKRRLAQRQAGAYIRHSYLGYLGQALEPVFRPLGWDWRITMSVLSSFPAREVVIATLGTIFNLGADAGDGTSASLVEKLRSSTWTHGPQEGQPLFSVAVALSICVFFALCCQCSATLVTIRHETGRWVYALGVLGYMTAMAYLGALGVYQLMKSLGF
jgi:ferrous iron transport protein B